MGGLPAVLKSVDWYANIDASCANQSNLAALEHALMRVAVWSKQFESVDFGNPALCFVREMQVAGHQTAALLSLCIYKAAAATSRTLLETCLYYSYFRTHPEELTTLIRDRDYFVTKVEIIEYHKRHTDDFMKYQNTFGLIGEMNKWYSETSAIVHGQVPGVWNAHAALKDINFDKTIYNLALGSYLKGETLVHQFLLCTCGKQLWSNFAPDAKAFLVKGLPGEKRAELGLDSK